MKTKTINSVIKKKMNEWLSSIEDQELVKLIKRDVIVTGGCIASMLLNEPVNDFDVYFKTKETTKAVAEYYAKKFNENNKDRKNKVGRPMHAWVLDGEDVQNWQAGEIKLSDFAFGYGDDDDSRPSGMITNTTPDRIKMMVNSDGIAEDSDTIADDSEYDMSEYLDAVSDGDEVPAEDMEGEKYRPIFLSTNAITLSNKVQLVIRFYGAVDEIHENYDFVHVTNYWEMSTGRVVLNERALEAILNRELFYVGSKYPIASLIRTRKFIKRGWQINAGQYVKMAWQISELDLTDINVLEDQLVGVDSIYFLQFIESMRKKKEDPTKEFVISRDYVTSVIDRIFG